MKTEKAKIAVRALVALCMMLFVVAVSWALCGCQTRVTIESDATTPLPIHQAVPDGGTNKIIVVGYYEGRPHYYITARSPLFANESVAKFSANVGPNGTWSIDADGYRRDLSTNAVVMVKTIFDGSANLAAAVAKAYATISTCGASDAGGAIVSRIVSAFKSAGGDEAKSTVTVEGDSLKVSDGSVCVTCDYAGNCTTGNCTIKQ